MGGGLSINPSFPLINIMAMSPISRKTKLKPVNNMKIDQFFKPLPRTTTFNDENSQERPRSSSLPPILQHSKSKKPTLDGKVTQKPTKTFGLKKNSSKLGNLDAKAGTIDTFFEPKKTPSNHFVDENEGHQVTTRPLDPITQTRVLKKLKMKPLHSNIETTDSASSICGNESESSVPVYKDTDICSQSSVNTLKDIDNCSQSSTYTFNADDCSQHSAFVIYRDPDETLNTQYIPEPKRVGPDDLLENHDENQKIKVYADDNLMDNENRRIRQLSPLVINYPDSDSEEELPQVPETKARESTSASTILNESMPLLFTDEEEEDDFGVDPADDFSITVQENVDIDQQKSFFAD